MTVFNQTSNESGSGLLVMPIIAGVGLVLLAALIVWLAQIKPGQDASELVTEQVASGGEATSNSAGPDVAAAQAVVDKAGCSACHTIPGISGAEGQVGPNLSNIGAEAATRREGYNAEQYIRESLAAPLAFTAPKCPTGPCPLGGMPPLQLSEAEIDVLVTYLVTLGGK